MILAGPERITVHDIARSTEIDRCGRGHLTAFADGELLRIRGWAIGNDSPAVEAEVLSGDPATIVGRTAISLPRPDVARTPHEVAAETAGFTLALQPDGSGTSELTVQVGFADGSRVQLGSLRVESV